jgi:uncharacterized protein
VDFRFSPRANDAHRIDWRPWGDEAFAAAQASDRPLLLSISAVWCHWCHVMDETTFSDPDVIDTLNRLFVCVRVDNDRRPDVNRRYNMGGWPTVAFLTPTGEIMTGATYVPARQFADLARAVHDVWQRKAADIRDELHEVRARQARELAAGAPVGEVTPALVAAALAPLYDAYDVEFGGFGDRMKFPRTDALDALLAQAEAQPDQSLPREILARTLDAMRAGGLWDKVEGGFFRYATQRDWSTPHYEKMLEDNAQLIRVFAHASVLLDRPDFAEVAGQTRRYLDATLRHREADGSGLYGGSQDADEEYFARPSAEQRQTRPAPYVDVMTYTDWNAQAARGLVSLGVAIDDEGAIAQAAATVRTLLARRDAHGLFAHDAGPQAATDLLGDQVSMLEALLALATATGSRDWIAEAAAVARTLDERFASPGSPLLGDLATPPAARASAPGETAATPGARLDRQETPPAENARVAVAVAHLARLTRDPAGAERARQLAAGLAPLVDKMGDFTGPIASAALAVLVEPWHVTVVGARDDPDVQALHRAARGLGRQSLTLELLDPATEGDLIATEGFGAVSGADDQPRAYVCVGTRCSAPVASPAELAALAASMHTA